MRNFYYKMYSYLINSKLLNWCLGNTYGFNTFLESLQKMMEMMDFLWLSKL